MPAPRTARERVREELTAEILAVARTHLAREGPAGLSLRSIARDLEIAPSALYRYFDGRDALITALILAAFESLATEAERAAEAAAKAAAKATAKSGGSDAERFLAVPRALRRWALARPHEWGLVFGTPVPGYEAPQDTIGPYARVAAAMARPVVEAEEAGRLRPDHGGRSVPDALRAAVAPVTEGLLPGLPPGTVVRVVQAWAAILGTISLEVFGHWRNTVLDTGEFFESTVRDAAETLGLS
jgi:AcrR family transcriptional regulator